MSEIRSSVAANFISMCLKYDYSMVLLICHQCMYRCEDWTIKKAEHRRIDAFKLLLEKTLENP